MSKRQTAGIIGGVLGGAAAGAALRTILIRRRGMPASTARAAMNSLGAMNKRMALQ